MRDQPPVGEDKRVAHPQQEGDICSTVVAGRIRHIAEAGLADGIMDLDGAGRIIRPAKTCCIHTETQRLLWRYDLSPPFRSDGKEKEKHGNDEWVLHGATPR